jgi:hypothetical protein
MSRLQEAVAEKPIVMNTSAHFCTDGFVMMFVELTTEHTRSINDARPVHVSGQVQFIIDGLLVS